MKATERIERINSNLNTHFKRNKSNWWVSHSPHDKGTIMLHLYQWTPIQPSWVAKYIFKTEKGINVIIGSKSIYTRRTMGLA